MAQSEQNEQIVPLNHLPALKGDYFKIESENVGRPFHIYVRYPLDYEEDKKSKYPVVYLLDGDSLFPILATNHLFLHFDEKLPEAIIVGISYGGFGPDKNHRSYDYSMPSADGNPDWGGASAFHAFLKSELLPKVESKYRIDPGKRVLFGQSRGGNFILYSAFTDPDLFWGRIASNPVFYPAKERFFEAAAKATRTDLGLAVVSGSRDRADRRADHEEWVAAWLQRDDAPWAVKGINLEGATHAANSTDAYRSAMLWLFSDQRK